MAYVIKRKLKKVPALRHDNRVEKPFKHRKDYPDAGVAKASKAKRELYDKAAKGFCVVSSKDRSNKITIKKK